MFCEQCGKEIEDSTKFCGYCGAAVNVLPPVQEEVAEPIAGQETKEHTVQESPNPQKKKIYIGIAAGIFVLAAATATVFAIRQSGKGNEKKEVLAETEEEPDEKPEETEAETAPPAEEEAPVEDEYTLLVSVPADYMSLRVSPGLESDVVKELTAGVYLKWYGETVMENDLEFYKVTVRETGEEGYVAADFCVNVDYEADEAGLSIVETNSVLYTYDMMTDDITALCNQYPDRLSSRVIGYSVYGREIYEVTLGNPNAENHVMMQAGIHAREYITSLLAMRMLEYYAAYYDDGTYRDMTYRDLFQNMAIHIVPMSNPDGVTISQLGVEALGDDYLTGYLYECYVRDKGTLVYEADSNGDMNWADYYKDAGFSREAKGATREITFDEYQTIWKANANGVDLNKNFDAGWAAIDAKWVPAYSNFKGDYPVSEPETQALVDLALERDYRCFISYHSRGQLIYYDVKGNSPENTAASENFVHLLESCIKYRPVNTNKAYNVSLGGFGDWVQLYLNKPSVTIESGKKPCPTEIGEFPAIWYRHRESWALLGYQF